MNDAEKRYQIAPLTASICRRIRSHQICLSIPFLFDPSQKHTNNTNYNKYHTNELDIFRMHVSIPHMECSVWLLDDSI